MRRFGLPAMLGAACLASLLFMPRAAPLFTALFPGVHPPVYDRGSFLALALSHLALVLSALSASAMLGIGGAILVTRRAGASFWPMVETIATIGQAFPPAAVLALLVPVIGFGDRPTVIALTLYGLLPITQTSLAGFASVPETVLEAARGMGLSTSQILWRVEIPLAGRSILAGVRNAALIGLGTATIGSTVGALTLGTPIIDGLVSNKAGFVLQGAIPLALLAVFFDLCFDRIDAFLPAGRRSRRHSKNRVE